MKSLQAKINTNLLDAKTANSELGELPVFPNKSASQEDTGSGSTFSSGPGGWGGIIDHAIDSATEVTRSINDMFVDVARASTGNYPEPPVIEKDNSTLWLTVGGVAVVAVIVILIISLKN